MHRLRNNFASFNWVCKLQWNTSVKVTATGIKETSKSSIRIVSSSSSNSSVSPLTPSSPFRTLSLIKRHFGIRSLERAPRIDNTTTSKIDPPSCKIYSRAWATATPPTTTSTVTTNPFWDPIWSCGARRKHSNIESIIGRNKSSNPLFLALRNSHNQPVHISDHQPSQRTANHPPWLTCKFAFGSGDDFIITPLHSARGMRWDFREIKVGVTHIKLTSSVNAKCGTDEWRFDSREFHSKQKDEHECDWAEVEERRWLVYVAPRNCPRLMGRWLVRTVEVGENYRNLLSWIEQLWN